MNPRRLLAPALLAGLALAFACFVPEADLSGKACDGTHPCTTGYDCVSSRCVATTVPPDAGEPGLDASTGSCTGTATFCRSGDWYSCLAGQPILKDACAVLGHDCESSRGCLASCAAKSCEIGTACDEATKRCLDQPSCATAGDCDFGTSTGTCEAGACVPASASAVVSVGGSKVAAETSCYFSPDAGASGPFATMTGYVVLPTGKVSAQTIGLQLRVYRASEFNTQTNPPVVASGAAYDAGMPVDGGAVGVGAYTLSNVPTGVELVASSSGAGAVQTYQYFTLRPESVVSGVADQALTSYDEVLWTQLVAGAGAQVSDGRAGLVGQIYDCHSSPGPAKVEGATAALDVPGRAYYTFPDVVGIDPDVTATSNTGRFFFFDVPAIPLTVVANVGGDVLSQPVRTMPRSITLMQFRPPGR